MTKEFKKPDLNAPRYRPRKCNLLNAAVYKKFIARYPRYKDTVDIDTFKEVISSFNGAIWQTVVDTRNGVELPEQLGYIFIGTCPRKKSDNPDYKKSAYYNIRSQNQNWESDQHIAKIFYTNFESKYRFRFHELWGFTAVRDFKRTVAHTYPKEWKKYVVIDNMQYVSKMFRKQRFKNFKATQKVITPEEYDEFTFD